MRLLNNAVHPNANPQSESLSHRRATRAIVLDGENILLLYTERYHDYSLPGGGLDDGEDMVEGLIRELQEETGARDITNIEPFGCYSEYRPWYKDGSDTIHMESFCFTCDIHSELGDTALEEHEVNNGMRPVWMNIFDAIKHNEHTIANSDKQGLSVIRETFLLKLIAKELITT